MKKRLWLFLDVIFSWYLRLKPLRKDRMTTINIEFRRYRGCPLNLGNGTIIKPGDRLIEIHFNNAWFLHKQKTINSPIKMIWELSLAFCEDLKYLAEQIIGGKFIPEIRAIHSTTLFHQGAQRLGFTVMEVPDTLWRRLCQFYQTGLRQAYYPQEARLLNAGTKPPILKAVWMTRRKLLEKYGPQLEVRPKKGRYHHTPKLPATKVVSAARPEKLG